ncbi:MAG: class I SAM-dependent methyltransferase [Calditrichia bacterium]
MLLFSAKPKCSETFVHESSYQQGLVSKIHQGRLAVLRELFIRYQPPQASRWADFGCSNGFIIEQFLRSEKVTFNTICGYDNNADLLALAQKKKIAASQFHLLNLNEIHCFDEKLFSVVTCFETLEHVGNLQNALKNLVNATEPGGLLLISVPNEVRLPGIVKYWGRSLLRSNAYGDFFDGESRIRYLQSLLLDKPISVYRKAGLPGYGPHLGFDYRELRQEIEETYIGKGQLTLLGEYFTRMKMNVTWVLQKNSSTRIASCLPNS